MKGYVAVQKKLLTLCYALWRNDTEYDPMYYTAGRPRNNVKEQESNETQYVCKKVVPTSGTTARAAPTGCSGLKAATPTQSKFIEKILFQNLYFTTVPTARGSFLGLRACTIFGCFSLAGFAAFFRFGVSLLPFSFSRLGLTTRFVTLLFFGGPDHDLVRARRVVGYF